MQFTTALQKKMPLFLKQQLWQMWIYCK